MFWLSAFIDVPADPLRGDGGLLVGRHRVVPVGAAWRGRASSSPSTRRATPTTTCGCSGSATGEAADPPRRARPRPACRGRPGGLAGRHRGRGPGVRRPRVARRADLLPRHATRPPAPAPPRAGRTCPRSLVDQVCLDVPRSTYDVETGFWQELLGWPRAGRRTASSSVSSGPTARPCGSCSSASTTRRARPAPTSTSRAARGTVRSSGTPRWGLVSSTSTTPGP